MAARSVKGAPAKALTAVGPSVGMDAAQRHRSRVRLEGDRSAWGRGAGDGAHLHDASYVQHKRDEV